MNNEKINNIYYFIRFTYFILQNVKGCNINLVNLMWGRGL